MSSLFDRNKGQIHPNLEGVNEVTNRLYTLNKNYYKSLTRNFCDRLPYLIGQEIRKSDMFKEILGKDIYNRDLLSEELLSEFRLSFQGILEDYVTEDMLHELTMRSVLQDIKPYLKHKSPKRKRGWVMHSIKNLLFREKLKTATDQPIIGRNR